MEMPQIVMLQLFSEQPDKPVLSDGIVRGQVFFEVFSEHEKSVRKYRLHANIIPESTGYERTAVGMPKHPKKPQFLIGRLSILSGNDLRSLVQ
jgi:hypothetical protein